jgi:hypothetical protein
LRERPTCMICGDRIISVHRFSDTRLANAGMHLPASKYSGTSMSNMSSTGSSMHGINLRLEAALSHLIQALVHVKTRLREVKSCRLTFCKLSTSAIPNSALYPRHLLFSQVS